MPEWRSREQGAIVAASCYDDTVNLAGGASTYFAISVAKEGVVKFTWDMKAGGTAAVAVFGWKLITTGGTEIVGQANAAPSGTFSYTVPVGSYDVVIQNNTSNIEGPQPISGTFDTSGACSSVPTPTPHPTPHPTPTPPTPPPPPPTPPPPTPASSSGNLLALGLVGGGALLGAVWLSRRNRPASPAAGA